MSTRFSQMKEERSVFEVARLHLDAITLTLYCGLRQPSNEKYSISASTGCTVTRQANGLSGSSSNHLNNLF